MKLKISYIHLPGPLSVPRPPTGIEKHWLEEGKLELAKQREAENDAERKRVEENNRLRARIAEIECSIAPQLSEIMSLRTAIVVSPLYYKR